MLSNFESPWPNFTEEEIEAVSSVLRSNKVNYWTGSECKTFESEFSQFSETDYSICVANGTLALDLALHGLCIGSRNGGSEFDEVIVTPRSFIASVSSIVNAGARPIFADVDIFSQNISPKTVEPLISSNTRAILCVHFAGWPCDMDGFRTLIDSRNIKLIEDCAQAHGAKYKGRAVGGLGDVAAWSFCQDKIMTTGGEGGMVTCNDKALWERMWAYKDHGKAWNIVSQPSASAEFRWVHTNFGTNFRLTEMQAAIGRIQLRKMNEWNLVRNQNAQDLAESLSDFVKESGQIRLTNFEDDSDFFKGSVHAFYRFYAFVRPENLQGGTTRKDIIKHFNDLGLPCSQGACAEIYLESAFDNSGFRPEKRLPVAKSLGDTSLAFLVHPGVKN